MSYSKEPKPIEKGEAGSGPDSFYSDIVVYTDWAELFVAITNYALWYAATRSMFRPMILAQTCYFSAFVILALSIVFSAVRYFSNGRLYFKAIGAAVIMCLLILIDEENLFTRY